MNSISAIARSGMNVAQRHMDASAHNVANAMTPEFRRQKVLQEAQPGGGVSSSVVRAEEPGPDLAADAVQQITALYNFKANVMVVKTEHEMLGSLLDLKA